MPRLDSKKHSKNACFFGSVQLGQRPSETWTYSLLVAASRGWATKKWATLWFPTAVLQHVWTYIFDCQTTLQVCTNLCFYFQTTLQVCTNLCFYFQTTFQICTNLCFYFQTTFQVCTNLCSYAFIFKPPSRYAQTYPFSWMSPSSPKKTCILGMLKVCICT